MFKPMLEQLEDRISLTGLPRPVYTIPDNWKTHFDKLNYQERVNKLTILEKETSDLIEKRDNLLNRKSQTANFLISITSGPLTSMIVKKEKEKLADQRTIKIQDNLMIFWYLYYTVDSKDRP